MAGEFTIGADSAHPLRLPRVIIGLSKGAEGAEAVDGRAFDVAEGMSCTGASRQSCQLAGPVVGTLPLSSQDAAR